MPTGGGDGAVKSPDPAPTVTVKSLFLDRYAVVNGAHGVDRRSGDQTVLRGTLKDESGEFAGELFSSSITMPGPIGEGSSKTPRMEFQNLHLSDGTITAMGTVFAQVDIPNIYTIVGGTGRYANLRGTYRFDDNPNVARPIGRATIAFDVSNV
jgi:hypothetical protein